MGGSSRCIGGISEDRRSIRLLNHNGANWNSEAPFQLGQVWDMSFVSVRKPVPPHTEDVLVMDYKFIAKAPDLRALLISSVKSWKGNIEQIFDSTVRFTSSCNGYICQRRGVPAHSTGFWIPDRGLTLRDDGRPKRKASTFPYAAGVASSRAAFRSACSRRTFSPSPRLRSPRLSARAMRSACSRIRLSMIPMRRAGAHGLAPKASITVRAHRTAVLRTIIWCSTPPRMDLGSRLHGRRWRSAWSRAVAWPSWTSGPLSTRSPTGWTVRKAVSAPPPENLRGASPTPPG